jgi:thiol:disulfide interchange protein
MRAYYLPAAGGAMLVVSAFLPWVLLGDASVGGMPGTAGLWILGLGLFAIVLAVLSIITRKNSRHPLLLVGLTSLAILFVSYTWMARALSEHVWATSQAAAIVERTPVAAQPDPTMGSGVYIGLSASALITLFGLTIVVRKMKTPYAPTEDDD